MYIVREICAFVNAAGGKIIIVGVSDNGSVKGGVFLTRYYPQFKI